MVAGEAILFPATLRRMVAGFPVLSQLFQAVEDPRSDADRCGHPGPGEVFGREVDA